MKKYILSVIFSIGFLVSPAFAHQVQAAGLDSCEINALIQLILAFNADPNILTNVQTSLGTPTIGVDQSGNVCQPIAASTLAVDVFLIAGQSNAVGYGNAIQSPIPPAKKVLSFYKKTISEATDPVGNANAGSAWPAFGTAYYNATGRVVVFVPSAIPGSGQTAASDTGTGNWDTGGTLFNTSVNNLDVAMRTLSSSGYTPTFKGILWDQGENDAIAINKGFVTADEYQVALVKMIGRYRTQYGSSMPFYIFQTGTSPIESDVGYAAVRAVQAQVPNIDPYTRIVFQGAVGFPSRRLMKDAYHYTQAGYNEMGKIGAQNIVVSDVVSTIPASAPTINSFTASTYSISKRMFSVLSYSSSNIPSSSTCSIDNGVGSIIPNTTNTKTVFPTTSTTYTLSCTGGTSKTVTITVSSGTISANTPSCTIALGTSSCTVNLNWTITGATNPKITNSSDSVYNNLYTSGSSGTVTGTVKTVGSTLFGIYDGVASLGSVIVSAICASGSSWVNGSCQAVPTVTSSFTPSTITSTGSTVYRYDSQNTTHCVASHPDGTGGWDNIVTNASFPPTTFSASQFPTGLTTTITCYNATGQSSVSTATLTVTNLGASAYDAYGSASNGAKNSEISSPQGTGDTSGGFHYVWNNNLQIGSSNTEDVKALQTALTREGVYTGEISGGFYNQTFSAVKAFQQKYGIDTGTNGAGFVGSKTRVKLNTLY